MKITIDLPDDIALPNIEQIIKRCIEELIIKHKNYGDSWKTTLDIDWWKMRIENEIDEFKKAIDNPARERKLINIINICMFTHTLLDHFTKTKSYQEKYNEIVNRAQKLVKEFEKQGDYRLKLVVGKVLGAIK